MYVKNAYGTNANTIAIFPLPHIKPTVDAMAIIIIANKSLETLFTPRPNQETKPSIKVIAWGAVPDVGGIKGGSIVLWFSNVVFKTVNAVLVAINALLGATVLISYSFAYQVPCSHPAEGA